MNKILMIVAVTLLGSALAYAGPPAPSAECGGVKDTPCKGKGTYCFYEDAENCGRGDEVGTCELRPDSCPEVSAPVCGCDGVTYMNDCKAAQAGVSVDFAGSCSGGTTARLATPAAHYPKPSYQLQPDEKACFADTPNAFQMAVLQLRVQFLTHWLLTAP